MPLAHLDPLTLAGLFLVALVAAAFDAIGGGGGLMTLPSLLIAGLDPVSAIATNKLSSTGGSVSATIVFARRRLIDWRVGWVFALAAFAAALVGAASVSLVPRDLLRAIVPFILIAIAVYFALAHRPRDADAQPRLKPSAFAALANLPIGFYDGVFGPGTGSFLMVAFVTLLGYGVVRATAHTKLANAASNLGALALFIATGKVVWSVGLLMALGGVVGGQIGSRLAIRHGATLIRPLIVTISCLMALKLLADPANPLFRALRDAL